MKKQDDYEVELQNSFDRWTLLYEQGGSDPFWEDGYNLNLIRNHIINYRKKIEETIPMANYPTVYYKDVPQEVNPHYMARADEIRAKAKISLEKYKSDTNYKYIMQHKYDFKHETQEKLCISNILGYVNGLEEAIKNDSLINMRRHEACENYLKVFENCALKMQLIPPETMQLSLFSLIGE